MQLAMTTREHDFLNFAQPVADVVWNLQATVGGSGEDTVSVAPGENIGDSGLGISDPDTAATILDGVSGEAQDITLAFNDSSPGDGTTPVATPFDLTFTGTVPVYVLAASYQDGSIPPGRSEMDLRIEVYDTNTGSWVPAISLNTPIRRRVEQNDISIKWSEKLRDVAPAQNPLSPSPAFGKPNPPPGGGKPPHSGPSSLSATFPFHPRRFSRMRRLSRPVHRASECVSISSAPLFVVPPSGGGGRHGGRGN
jgi:hypothetical protein